MSGVDAVLVKKIEKRHKRQTGKKILQEREHRDISRLNEVVVFLNTSESNDSNSSLHCDEAILERPAKRQKKYPKVSVKDMELISTWDREKLSV